MAFCPNCGSQVNDGAGFCGNCGTKLGGAPQQAAPAQQAAPQQQYAQPQQQPVYVVTNPNSVPGWQTSAGMTILGIVCSFVFSFICGLLSAFAIGTILEIAYFVFAIFYALSMYPKYFTEGLGTKTAGTVSLLNGFIGGIIFGCLWNANLTKGTKGISNVVFVVLSCASIILTVLAVLGIFGVAMLGAY